jgi:broad specificity phosphatase PhoE
MAAGPQLLLIRHGQTEWSVAGRHTGHTDVPLTEQGRAEALDAARTLAGWSIARAFTSPLERARETAEIVGLGCELTVDEHLMEWDYGDFEGVTTESAREHVPGWSVWTHPMTGGESLGELGERADRFIGRAWGDVPTGNVAVFAHGHLLAVLIARWCGLDPVEGRRFYLATATVSLLGWHREDRVIRALNHRAGEVLDPPSRT